jgi:drug/metabolite transporter (DMT)-like permease
VSSSRSRYDASTLIPSLVGALSHGGDRLVSTRRNLALFALTSVLFGGTFVAAKAGLAYFPPLLFVALRFDVAAVVLAAYVVATTAREDLLPRSAGDVVAILATGVFVIGLANALLFVGQEHLSSGVAAIIFSLNPILTPVFAMVFLANERLSTRGVVGLLVGLVGVGLVVGVDPSALLGGSARWKGVVFAAAAAGALGTILIRRADTDLSSTVRTAWALPVSALLTHAGSLAAGESLAAVTWAPGALVALGYVGVFAGAMAYLTYFGLLDEVGPIHGNLVFYATPIVATLGGWALLGETISSSTLTGFAVIFVGFAVLASESVEGDLETLYETVRVEVASEDIG